MSYCRFSSDNFKSDFYVYGSDLGWEIIVAGNRVVGDIPPLVEWGAPGFFEALKKQQDFVSAAKHEPITLPHAGASFTEKTVEGAIEMIEELIALGFHAPAHLLEDLKEELTAK